MASSSGGGDTSSAAASMPSAPAASPGVEFAVSAPAYAKMVLHALKYAHSPVSGVLVGERRRGGSWRVVDAVPLLHQGVGLAAPMEAALCQVDAACQATSSATCQMVGLYHANERFDDNAIDHFTSRLGEKVHSVFPDAILLRVESKLLGAAAGDTPCYVAHSYAAESKSWKHTERVHLENEERTMETLSSCVQMKMYRYLVDFDNHLDNPSLDYWNRQLTSKIVSLMRD